MNHLDHQITRTRYLKALLRHHNTLPLQLHSASYTLPLQMIFQPLKLRYHSSMTEKAIEKRVEKHVSRNENQGKSIQDVVEKIAFNGIDALKQSSHKRMVILGDPGMGKTTLLKDLLRQTAQQALTDLEAPVPIFLSLPDLARSGKTLQEYIPHTLAALTLDLQDVSMLIDAIIAEQAFFCLDSLDEVLPALRPDMIALINREALSIGGSWVIGSRFTEYQGGQFAAGRFDEWELQPLDDVHQLQLAQSLLPSFQSQFRLDSRASQEGDAKLSRAASLIVTTLHQDERTISWAKSPLLLSLVTAVYATTGSLPASRASLYSEIINALLAARLVDLEQRLELRSLLADISLSLYQTRGRDFTVEELLALLRISHPMENATRHYTRVASILDAGLFEKVADQAYSFKHQMFQEYLAALALARQLCGEDENQRQAAWKFIWSKYTYSRWSEILRFLVGILEQEYGETGQVVALRWLHALAGIRKQPTGDVGYLGLMLALRSLPELALPEQTAELAELMSDLVVAWAEGLIAVARRLQSYRDHDARLERLQRLTRDIRTLSKPIVEAGITLLTTTVFDPGEDELLRYHIIQILGDLGQHAPVQAFFSYMRDHPLSHSLSLEHTLQKLGSQAPLELLIAAALNTNEDWKVREQATLMLGRSGRPEVVDILVQMAREDESIAGDAIDALALLDKHAPLDVFIDILLNNNGWGDSNWSSSKRMHAALALGELGDERAIEPLVRVLTIAQDQENDEIAEALIKLPVLFPYEQLLKWLTSKNVSLQWLATEKLALSSLPVPSRPLLALLRKRVQRDDYLQHRLRASALHLLNQQASLIPFHDLKRLLKENHWSLKDELRQAFNLHGEAAPIDILFKTLVGDEHGPAIQALEILKILHQEIPAELLFAHYAHDETGMGSQEAEWGRELLQYGTRLPAETLITIACECINYIEDYDDEDIVEVLSKQGTYIVDALLAKLPEYGVLDANLLPRVIHSIYAWIPEENLVHTLGKSAGDRYMAAGILALTGDEHYLPTLLALLEQQSPHPDAYCKMLSALAKFRGRFPLNILLSALQTKNFGINDTALDILRELHNELAISQLVGPLKAWLLANKDDHSHHGTARSRCAIAALSFCGQYAPVDLLVPLLEDHDLRDEVLEALVRLSQFVPFEIFFTLLSNQDEYIRDGAVIGLGRQKDRVPLEKLFTLFSLHIDQNSENKEAREAPEDDEDAEERIDHKGIARAVMEVLIELDEYASTEKIAVFLRHEDENVREGARRVLVELNVSTPLDYFIRKRGGDYDDEKVRPSIIKAQIALGEQAAFASWIDALDDESSNGLSEGAALVLDALARVVPTKILELALECDRPGMRMARLRAWSVLGQVDEIISAAWSDKQGTVRQKAIEILGDLKYPKAVDALANLLRNENDLSLLSALIEALGKQGNAVPLEPLLECCGYRESEWWKWGHFEWGPGIEAAQTVKEAHPEAFRALVPLAEAIVRGETPTGIFASRTQSRLADAIGAIGRSEPPLLAILTNLLNWPYWQVRMKAAQAYGKIQRNIPDAAIQRLLILRQDLQSRAVREAADDALTKILALENNLEDG